MMAEILDRLGSPERKVRLEGWQKFHEHFTHLRAFVSREQLEILAARLIDEGDEGVAVFGMKRMIAYFASQSLESGRLLAGAVPAAGAARMHATPDVESLDSWFWQPVRAKFALFGLTDPQRRKRDEVTLIHLAQHCGQRGVDKANIHLMRVDDGRWAKLLFHGKYSSICFAGRLGIFGAEAVTRWGNPDGRFGFLLDRRPEHLKAGELDPQYHCITERQPDGTLVFHRSYERAGKRYDFGLVKRYTVRDGGRFVTVINFAGGSGLGTLAAATWAMENLSEPALADGRSIPVPPQIEPGSPLEALIWASADVASEDWEPDRIELRQLYAGRHVWQVESGRWAPLTCSHITLVHEGNKVVSVLLDGKPLSMKPTSICFRLLVALCLQVRHSGQEGIDTQRLASDRKIWKGRNVTERDVRARLASLRHRYLKECLHIGPTITLTAKVAMESARHV